MKKMNTKIRIKFIVALKKATNLMQGKNKLNVDETHVRRVAEALGESIHNAWQAQAWVSGGWFLSPD